MADQIDTVLKEGKGFKNGDLRKTMVWKSTKLMWTLFPNLTMKMIETLFFVPRTYRMSKAEQACLDRGTPFTLTVLGKKVQAWRWGTGPTVLLAHGWAGRGIQLSCFIKPLLDSGHSVVAYDSLAHGESDGRTTNFYEFIQCLEAMVNYIGKVKMIAAHSMGAGAAMNVALSMDTSVKLVLLAPMFYLKQVLYQFSDDLGLYRQPYDTIIQSLENRYGKKVVEVSPEAVIDKLKQPLLIFHDERDRMAPFHHTSQVLPSRPDIELVRTTGKGHNRILRDDKVIDQALKFFTGISVNSSSQSNIPSIHNME